MQRLYQDAAPEYARMFSTGPLDGSEAGAGASLWDAYAVYDYVKYMYAHNETVFNELEDAEETLAKLQNWAFQVERERNVDWNEKPLDDDPDNPVQSIAGRTLATEVIWRFNQAIRSRSKTDKMTLMFGSRQTFLAFADLALLSHGSGPSSPFRRLPEPGAAMVFELVGASRQNPGSFPSMQDLRVRFLFRPSTDEKEAFWNWSLFNSEHEGASIPYATFNREMERIAVRSLRNRQYCRLCKPVDSHWCSDSLQDHDTAAGASSPSSGPSAVVSGVIGAVVALAFLALLGAVLYFVFGFRVRREGKRDGGSMGGFRGGQRMASDVDVTTDKGGAHHARVGSWELGGDATARLAPPREAVKPFGLVSPSASPEHMQDERDAASLSGVSPQCPRESV